MKIFQHQAGVQRENVGIGHGVTKSGHGLQMKNTKNKKYMKLTKKDRLNLIQTLSQTGLWELLPIQLNDDETGLDRQRWEDMLQRLIDEK